MEAKFRHIYMQTSLYSSPTQKYGLWIMLRSCGHRPVCLWQVISKARSWTFDCLLLSFKGCALKCMQIAQNQKVFKVNIIRYGVLLLISKKGKKKGVIIWLFDLSVSLCGVFLALCFCRLQRFEVLSISCLHTIHLWLLPASGFVHSDASFHKAASFA